MRRLFRRRAAAKSADEQWAEEVVPRIAAAKEERLRLLAGQEALVASIEALLFEHDPVGISFETNSDEYRSEAETITLRLHEAASAADVRRIVHEEFVRWFDDDIAGPASRYDSIAARIWELARPGQPAW